MKEESEDEERVVNVSGVHFMWQGTSPHSSERRTAIQLGDVQFGVS